jgi:hypothetical protein
MNMKQLAFFMLLCNCLFGQERKFDFSISAVPLVSDNFLKGAGNTTKEYLANIRAREIGRIGFASQMLVRYRMNKRFYIQSGIGYLNSGYISDKVKLVPAVPDPTFPTYRLSSFNQHSITVPLLLQYYFNTTKNRFYLVGGFTPSFSVNAYDKSTLIYEGKSDITTKYDLTKSTRRVNLIGMLGVGYQRTVSSHLDLFIQPAVSLNLFSTFKSDFIIRHNYSLGLGVGVIFH